MADPRGKMHHLTYGEGGSHTLILEDEEGQCQKRTNKVVVIAKETQGEPNDDHCEEVVSKVV